MNAWMELVNGHCFRFQSVFPLEFKKRGGIGTLLTAITLAISDVLDVFYGRERSIWALTKTLVSVADRWRGSKR